MNEHVLDILTKGLSGKPIIKIEDWTNILKELKNHAVFCLPYDSIRKGGCLLESELAEYQKLCYRSISKNIQILNEQKRVVELFEENNIPFVILKGSAAAMYYRHPECRIMGDIDIIVKPVDLGRAIDLLGENYKCTETFNENPRHIGYMGKTAVEIELHKYFSFGERSRKKELLDQMIYEGVDNREWHEVRGYKFPCLPPIENGLVLLNHIYQHLQASGIGYRQIIDFREFVEAEKDYLPEFMEAAECVGLRKLAEALICIFNRYMGTSIEVTEVAEDIIKELMKEIMHAGNFGKKEGMDEVKRSALVLKASKNPIVLLKKLQRYGRVHWRATEKYIFLRPFAWIYQIGYYINQVKMNGGLSVIVKGKKRLSEKEKLFKTLGL